MNRRKFVIAGLLASCWATAATAMKLGVATPDVIYVNGNIYTGEPDSFVQAVAVADGHVIATGTTAQMRALAGKETKFEDLRGHPVIPGFYDGHVHVQSALLLDESEADLHSVMSLTDLQERLRAYAAMKPKSGWIRGTLPHANGGKEVFDENALPTRKDLDVVADYPVVLVRGHLLLLNSRALEIAGIRRGMAQPSGGKFDVDSKGEPTGVLREAPAWRLVTRKFPPPPVEPEDVLIGRLRDRLKQQLSLGVTSLNIPGVEPGGDLRLLQKLYATEGDALPRITIQIRLWPGYDRYDDLKEGIAASIKQIDGLAFYTGFGSDRIKIGAIKMSVDGAFSGQAAWLIDSYPGRPDFHGQVRVPPEALYAVGKHAYDRGWQLGLHAIGDEAVRQTVDVYERIIRENPRPDPRLYIHHISVKPPEATLQKIKDLDIIACMQPNFTFTVAPFYEKLLSPDKLQTNNPEQSLRAMGIRIAMGSDHLPDGPFIGLYSAVTRKGITGKTYGPEEKLTMAQAIYNATVGTAYMTFDEKERGVLRPGMVADMIVLPTNIFTSDPELLRTIRPLQTIVAGKTVYSGSGTAAPQHSEQDRGPTMANAHDD